MRFFAGGVDDNGRSFDEILGWIASSLSVVARHDYFGSAAFKLDVERVS